MRRIFLLGLFFFILSLFFPQRIFAQSSYVLPYPGVMPGNKAYAIFEFVDNLKGQFSFGDFAQFSHNLSQADKYLIEAKTLFEYRQYPLALIALDSSNEKIRQAKEALLLAKKHKKPTSEKKGILKSAAEKHTEVLENILMYSPEEFIWEDENKNPEPLQIKSEIEDAIKLRNSL